MSDESTPDGSKGSHTEPLLPSALARAARSPSALGTQKAWSFRSDGESEVIDSAVFANRRPVGGTPIRADARRAAEYLATRGKTPIEALHDVAGMRWQHAVRKISKELQCSRLEAFKVWQSCNVALLPYSAARFDTLELGSLAGGAAGSLTVAHFLAASMVAERLGVSGVSGQLAIASAAESPDRQSVDNAVTADLPLLDQGGRSDARAPLPPKPAD